MPLKEDEYGQIREELDSAKRPLIFFHDDPDGLCSYLQVYKHIGEGKGVIIKSQPRIDEKYLRKVEEYSPDKIIILDIALLDQDFVDRAKKPIVWIDHHGPEEIHGVKYFNPRKHGTLEPVSYLTYKAVEKSLWIAVTGTIADMHWPEDLVGEFRERYPGLLPEKYGEPRSALYETRLGELIKILSFVLKGTSTESLRYAKVLTRVKDPMEILDGTTARGKYILKRFEQINSEYVGLLEEARASAGKSKILLYTYRDRKYAFSGDLANELIYRHPDKLVIVGREKSGEYKCSFRSNDTVLPPLIEKALEDCEGYGGGHEYAAGGCIKADCFSRFVDNLKKGLS